MVGNGGFSLRKLSSAIRVLESKALLEGPVIFGQRIRWVRSQSFLRRGYGNNVRFFVQQYCRNPKAHEDFWSL
jgi:hypothetical protein